MVRYRALPVMSGETEPKKKRAPRVAAPGAQRVTFTGIMATPDSFGRLRILLTDRSADDRPNYSLANLRRAIPAGPGYKAPYEVASDRRPGDDVVATVVVVLPARYCEHWNSVAESLRGQEVRVEATVRPFSFAKGDSEHIAGASLDLALLEAVKPPPAASGQISSLRGL